MNLTTLCCVIPAVALLLTAIPGLIWMAWEARNAPLMEEPK